MYMFQGKLMQFLKKKYINLNKDEIGMLLFPLFQDCTRETFYDIIYWTLNINFFENKFFCKL